MAWWQIAYWGCALLTIGIGLLMSLQTWEHRRYARSRGREVRDKPPEDRVALFLPCKGSDADLEDNLRPIFEQTHTNHELVFIVESVDDGAYAPIRKLMAEYADRPARLVVAGLATTSGQKVHNLLVATENLPADIQVLAFADADIRPPREWLRLLTQRLDTRVASSGYRRFVPKRTTLANLLLSSIDGAVAPIMFPSIHHKVWGGSWAIRRDAFEETRLRDAWVGTLSDDLVAGSVLARMRKPLALESACILPSSIDIDLATMLAWVRRQFIIGRFYSPWLWSLVFAGQLLAQIVFWGSAVAAAVGAWTGATWTWQPSTVVAMLYALHVFRGWLRQDAARYYLPDQQQALAAARRFDIACGPVAGLVLCVALIGSAIGRRIRWKNNVYEMRYGGQIRKIPARPDAPLAAPGLVGAARRQAA